MNNILFLTGDLSLSVDNGGTVVNKNNFTLLQSFPETKITVLSVSSASNIHKESDIVFIASVRNKIETILMCLMGYSGSITPKVESIVLDYLEKYNYNILFLDRSNYGRIAKKVKRLFPMIKIVTYFHNVEWQYTLHRVKIEGIQYLPFLVATYLNEKAAVKYSDITIAINNHDKIQLENIYNTKITGFCSSIWFNDYSQINKNNIENISSPLEVLFLGSWGYANISGIKWFIQYVLPNVNIRLTIAGRNMEKLQTIYTQNENMRIIGTVQDTVQLYMKADCVIAPIFAGSGMKVKTGEALHYGKTVVGTRAAFAGYDITNGLEGYICESPEDFIEAIETISHVQRTKINKASLEYAKLNLTLDNRLQRMKSLIIEN